MLSVLSFFSIHKIFRSADADKMANLAQDTKSLGTTDIDYEEEWWRQNTPLESNTQSERLWFNGVDTDSNSEQKYNDLMANNRRRSTPYLRNTPQSFSRQTRSYAFSRGR